MDELVAPGGCRSSEILQSFSLSTSGTAAGAQRELETRRSFKGAPSRGHPKESLLPGLTQQGTQSPGWSVLQQTPAPCAVNLEQLLRLLLPEIGSFAESLGSEHKLFLSGLEARWEGLKLCCCWTPEAKLSSGSLLWGQAWSQETEGSFPLLRKLFFLLRLT